MSRYIMSVALVSLVAFGLAGVAQAELVTNGGFEEPAIAGDFSAYNVPTGWTMTADRTNSVIIRVVGPGAATWYPAIDGNQIWDAGADTASNANGIYQNLGTMTEGTTYTLTAKIASGSWTADVIARKWSMGFSSVETSTVLKQITDADFTLNPTATFEILPVTMSYTALAGDEGNTLRLSLRAANDGPVYRTGMDSVSVTTSSIPEPSSIVLLAAGLLGLLAYAWRKRK